MGDPAALYPPERHEDIWPIQRELDWPGTVYGLEREAEGETLMPRAIASCQLHASAPDGLTPTARSCMMPSGMPARTALPCASASCSSSSHWSQR